MTKLNTLVQQIIDRNKEIQQQKNEGVSGWIISVVLALISLVGIGVVLWLSSRRARELAKLRTELEQTELKQAQLAYEARKIPLKKKRDELFAALKRNEIDIQQTKKELKQFEEAYNTQKKKIDSLRTWKEINEV